MISNTNNKSDQSETIAISYELLLYWKKDIIAIQEKLGIDGYAIRANPIILQERISKSLRNLMVP
jgi:hypothetical protein